MAQSPRNPLDGSDYALMAAAKRRSNDPNKRLDQPSVRPEKALSSRKIGRGLGLRVARPFARVAKGRRGVGSARVRAPPGGFGGRRAVATKHGQSMVPRVVPPRAHDLAS